MLTAERHSHVEAGLIPFNATTVDLGAVLQLPVQETEPLEAGLNSSKSPWRDARAAPLQLPCACKNRRRIRQNMFSHRPVS